MSKQQEWSKFNFSIGIESSMDSETRDVKYFNDELSKFFFSPHNSLSVFVSFLVGYFNHQDGNVCVGYFKNEMIRVVCLHLNLNLSFKEILKYVKSSMLKDSMEINSKCLENVNLFCGILSPVSSKMDLVLVNSQNGKIGFSMNSRIFTEEFGKRMMTNFEHFAVNLHKKQNLPIKDISWICDYEKNTILRWSINQSASDVNNDRLVKNMFEVIAKTHPKKTALRFNDQTMNYCELNESSNQLSKLLKLKFGVVRGSVIGVCTLRNFSAIISMLSIIKLGAVYFPMDNLLPKTRLMKMIKMTGCKVVICDSKFNDKFSKDVNICVLQLVKDVCEKQDKSNPVLSNFPVDSPTVCLFTSGTTGNHKGVFLENRGLVNIASNHFQIFQFSTDDVVTFFSSVAFVAHLWILPPLLHGLTVVIIPQELRYSISKLPEYYQKSGATIVKIPPAVLSSLPKLKKLGFVKKIMFSGSKCDSSTLEYWCDKVELYNMWGQTELTGVACIKKWTKGSESSNIGKPFKNLKCHIMDHEMLKIVPIGVIGELCLVQGVQVAKTYIGQDLGKQKNSFPSKKGIYRTGDLCYYNNSGDLVFVSRMDNIVKINGMRVDLEEVERVLKLSSDCNHCGVLKIEEDEALVVFVEQLPEKMFNEEKLKVMLAKHLPYYMIPRRIIALKKLPTTPISWKLDRSKLIEIYKQICREKREKFVLPKNENEKKVLDIFKGVLNLSDSEKNEIGICDDFFSVGGNSLSLSLLVSNLTRTFGREISINDLLRLLRINVKSLCEVIASVNENYQSEFVKNFLENGEVDHGYVKYRLMEKSDVYDALVFNFKVWKPVLQISRGIPPELYIFFREKKFIKSCELGNSIVAIDKRSGKIIGTLVGVHDEYGNKTKPEVEHKLDKDKFKEILKIGKALKVMDEIIRGKIPNEALVAPLMEIVGAAAEENSDPLIYPTMKLLLVEIGKKKGFKTIIGCPISPVTQIYAKRDKDNVIHEGVLFDELEVDGEWPFKGQQQYYLKTFPETGKSIIEQYNQFFIYSKRI